MVSLLGSSHFVKGRDIYIPSYNGIEQNLQKIAKYKPRKNDYILCSYPKSGMLNLFEQLLLFGDF